MSAPESRRAEDRKHKTTVFGRLVQMDCHLYRNTAVLLRCYCQSEWKLYVAVVNENHSYLDRCKCGFYSSGFASDITRIENSGVGKRCLSACQALIGPRGTKEDTG